MDLKENEIVQNDKIKELTPDEKIKELEDKIVRTFAEMENQRRRFEKEKEDAYEYGCFAFAKEALNLIDNLERSKQILSNDESIKNSESDRNPSNSIPGGDAAVVRAGRARQHDAAVLHAAAAHRQRRAGPVVDR